MTLPPELERALWAWMTKQSTGSLVLNFKEGRVIEIEERTKRRLPGETDLSRQPSSAEQSAGETDLSRPATAGARHGRSA